MAYALCITAGIVLAFFVRRSAPPAPHPHGPLIGAVALLGALSGAVLFELPADWFGWTAPLAGEPVVTHGIGGRTVLGGILGGWIAVEIVKPFLGVRVSTGDGFAAPLAVGLACGRVGCALTGCCAGRAVASGSWWHGLAVLGQDGVPRYPAALADSAFHALAAVVLVLLARRGALAGRRLAGYVAAYCVARVLLEELRDNPAVLGRWTYYQLLAVPLFLLAAGTFVVRQRKASAGVQLARAP